MNTATSLILEKLHAAAFDYPVAVYTGNDPEIGEVLYAVAFDVPEGPILQVSRHLNRVLGWIDSAPELLPGAHFDFDSAAQRAALPADTVWYQPRSRTHVPA